MIDDEMDVAELVTYLLEKEGHQVLHAEDGKEGLERVRQEAPDLIILDIMMPEMDGYTVNQHLMADPVACRIPVIVLTAKGGMQEISLNAPNIRFHLEKPFDPQELKDRVREALRALP